jgi:hypothetical protein
MRAFPAGALLSSLVLLTACGGPLGAPLEPESAAALRLEPIGGPQVVEGFATPESAIHDAVADVYLVSNVNGHPQILSNDGFISRVSPEGEILELEWIRGGENGVVLHAPTGITLVGDILYVADADAVRLFDRASGEPLDSWEVPVEVEAVPDAPDLEWVRGVLLNAVCAGPRGDIHLTATGIEIDLAFDLAPTGQDAVYRFRDGVPEAIATGPDLAGPNGCVVRGGNVHIAPLLSNEVYRLNASGRRFHVATLPQGGLDGFVDVGGFTFVSSIFGGQIFRMSAGGAQVTTILEDLVSPADIGFDHDRRRLLIPSLFGDFLLIQPMG